MGCGTNMEVYSSLVFTSLTEGLQAAFIGINWDDAAAQDLKIDPVALGMAQNQGDNCSITDLYDGKTTPADASE
jgi:hypothetical protein